MKTLSLDISREFTAEMDAVRRSSFGDSTYTSKSADIFDEHSSYIVARVDGMHAGCVRLTPNPPSVIQTWSRGKAPLPNGVGVIDATRGAIAPQFRGLGIYKLMMTTAIAWCRSQQANVIVAAVELNFPQRPFLCEIGFEDVGTPCKFWPVADKEIVLQSISLKLTSAWPRVLATHQRVEASFLQREIELSSQVQISCG